MEPAPARAIWQSRSLELNVRVERPRGSPSSPPDLRAAAAQVLSLTKLNWASLDALCAEPITTKLGLPRWPASAGR